MIASMTAAEVAIRESQIEGRIKRKLLALKTLVQASDVKVYIADGRVEQPIQNAIAGKGTVIQ